MNMTKCMSSIFVGASMCCFVFSSAAKQVQTFYFGDGTYPSGCERVTPKSDYSEKNGFGWLNDRKTLFGVQLPEGNYDVQLAYENPEAAANSTIKAEARRLMLKKLDRSEKRTRQFTVNIRQPDLEGGDRVRLNKRETEPTMVAHWDGMLTLEFLPNADGVDALKIVPAAKALTVYLAGDSTVTDQPNEPWCGWGQMLPSFFESGIAVANHAESGRALYSFRYEKRFEKILSTIQRGDYLFIQFGHNDQKNKAEGAGPFTTYKADLEDYVSKVRKKDALPVLVTPMERRRWKDGKPGETLSDFAEAVRLVGKEQKVPVIDLHAMSLKLYAALGEEGSKRAFVHYPANTFPGQEKALRDDTHHNVYGGYELARCMVEGIRAQVPVLASYLRPDAGSFDPSKPDDPDLLDIPASLAAGAEKPEGN